MYIYIYFIISYSLTSTARMIYTNMFSDPLKCSKKNVHRTAAHVILLVTSTLRTCIANVSE